MKIKLISKMSYEEIEKMKLYDDYECNDNSDNLMIEKIRYFLENYDKLTNKDYCEMICNFYYIKLEDVDYIDYINYKTGNKFDRIIKLETNVINKDTESEGHGRDFSWWTVSYRLCLKVAVNCELQNEDRYFTIDEIKELVNENKIYPIEHFREECDDRLYENRVKNDIDYLINDRFKGLDIAGEYFDYFMDKIKNEIGLDEILIEIRKKIIELKLDLVCRLADDYRVDLNSLEEEDKKVDELIDCYNKFIGLLKFEELLDSEFKLEDRLISKNPVDIVVKYIENLPNIDREEWYRDVTIDQIISVIETIDYEEENELCEKIQQMAINLGEKLEEPELCAELAGLYWSDFGRLENIVIDSRDAWCNYYFARDYDNADVLRHGQVVIQYGGAEINYEFARDISGADIEGHAKAVIESGSVWYNYEFACDIDGADIRAHGQVIINSGDAYYNSMFTRFSESDILGHYNAIMASDKKDEYKEDLKQLKRRLELKK